MPQYCYHNVQYCTILLSRYTILLLYFAILWWFRTILLRYFEILWRFRTILLPYTTILLPQCTILWRFRTILLPCTTILLPQCTILWQYGWNLVKQPILCNYMDSSSFERIIYDILFDRPYFRECLEKIFSFYVIPIWTNISSDTLATFDTTEYSTIFPACTDMKMYLHP